jgi:hypothetical protein
VVFTVTDVIDLADPVATVVTPGNGEAFVLGPVTLSGAATDDVAVDSVKVAIKDKASGFWLHSDDTWGGFAWLEASLSAPGEPAVDWSVDFDPPAAGEYALMVRAEDSSGNVQLDKPFVNFSFNDGGGDTVDPDATVVSPASNETFALGPIELMGGASDDVAVESVMVAIKDKATGKWWHGTGFEDGFRYLNAELSEPGAVSTDWNYVFEAPAVGDYIVTIRARDTSLNIDLTRPWVSFHVE